MIILLTKSLSSLYTAYIMNIRSDFPIFKQVINGYPLCYLDSAATTQKPQVVIDAIKNFYETTNAPIYRGVYSLAEHATELYEQVRSQTAEYINAAHTSEIVFTQNATDSINLIAQAYVKHVLQPGDEIVIGPYEHHANILPWHALGATVITLPHNKDWSYNYPNLDQYITRKTKLVALSLDSNVIGGAPIYTQESLQKIVDYAHACGAVVLFDAAQAIAHKKIDVQQLNCDFLVFSSHKMLGPTGVGITYINQRLHHSLQPYRIGGGMVYSTDLPIQWRSMPLLLEAGTPNAADIIGFGAALTYLKKLSFTDLQTHTRLLSTLFIDGLTQVAGATLIGPHDQKGHLVSFTLKDRHPHDSAALLDSYGICVRAGHQCAQPLHTQLGLTGSIRVSFYGYNTQEDVNICITILKNNI